MVGARCDFDFTVSNGALRIFLSPPAAGDLHVDLLASGLPLNSAQMEQVLTSMSPTLFGSITQSLSGFPLPQFAGKSLQPVDFGREGTGLVMFAKLVRTSSVNRSRPGPKQRVRAASRPHLTALTTRYSAVTSPRVSCHSQGLRATFAPPGRGNRAVGEPTHRTLPVWARERTSSASVRGAT